MQDRGASNRGCPCLGGLRKGLERKFLRDLDWEGSMRLELKCSKYASIHR